MKLVVKLAGALLEEPATIAPIAEQIAELARRGHELLVVHGGGKILTSTLARMGIRSRFVDGLRLTDPETRDVAVMVLGGLLNQRVVAAICQAGQPAVGLTGSDGHCFQAEGVSHQSVSNSLGLVGYVTGVNSAFLESLWQDGLVPVAACLAAGANGEIYNINADHMAAACAHYLQADALIYLTDVPGVLDGDAVLRAISPAEFERLAREKKVSGGMVLKLEACTRALQAGVPLVHVVGGSLKDSLLDSLNGSKLGTRVLRTAAAAPEAVWA